MGSGVFWAVVLGFLCGVFARSEFLISWSAVGFCILLSFVVFAFIYIDREKSTRYIFLGIFLFFCALGIVRMELSTLSGDPKLTKEIGTHVVIEGVVSAEPDARENATLLSVDAQSIEIGSTSISVQAGVLATLPAHAKVAYGDRIKLSGQLQLPAPFDTGLGRQFNYPQYLAAQGIEYQLGFAQIDSIEDNVGKPIEAFAINMKESYLQGTRAVLPEPEAALAGGITVGDKRSVGPELSQDFQRDSLVHMIVLSGYNITVVLNAVTRLLSFAPRVVQFGGSITVVIFFALISGGASSAIRAGLMALIATLARATRRTYLGERALAAVSFAMVLWNPWTLCFDPSFQLSALATLGLILCTPTFFSLFSFVPEKFGMREILSSTCGTQLMVLPFLLYQNGTLSLVALPANLFALLPVPYAMLLSFIAALAGMTFHTYGSVVALPAYALLWYIVTVAHLFASLPFAAVSVPAFSALWLFAAYATLFAFLLYKNRSRHDAGTER